MPTANCADCKRRFRANEVTGDTCGICRRDQREADREANAALRMSVAVFGTNDPDELAGTPRALHSCRDCGSEFPGPRGGFEFVHHRCTVAA